MIDQLLLVFFLVLAAPGVLVAIIWWLLKDCRVAARCRRGRHEWRPEPTRGAGNFSLITRCRHCGAEYVRHRGF